MECFRCTQLTRRLQALEKTELLEVLEAAKTLDVKGLLNPAAIAIVDTLKIA